MATSYIKDDQGETFIPASQRPDGTWRKPRRVKDGYVPQEEVPLYESLGKQFLKSKSSFPPGMSAEFVAAHKAKVDAEKKSTIPGMVIVNERKKKKKKNKTKGTDSLASDLAKTSISEPDEKTKIQPVRVQEKSKQDGKKAAKSQPLPSAREEPSILSDSMKRLKNLRKKIREIETLENKIKIGEIKNPEKEMLEKVGRKREILQEIKMLESNQ